MLVKEGRWGLARIVTGLFITHFRKTVKNTGELKISMQSPPFIIFIAYATPDWVLVNTSLIVLEINHKFD